jgi:hypothetical protein
MISEHDSEDTLLISEVLAKLVLSKCEILPSQTQTLEEGQASKSSGNLARTDQIM